MKHWLLFFTLLWANALSAQNNPMKHDLYSKEWARIDSLLDNGLPQSAEKQINQVYARAKAASQPVQVLKAQLYLLRTLQHGEAADTAMIRRAEAQLRDAGAPNSFIWHSILAQLYQNYYNGHRYELLDRSRLGSSASSADLQEWDAYQFFRTISRHYLLSVDPKTRPVRIDAFTPILDTGTNTRHLRPTLYDLLAYRAIAFFEQDEQDIAQPAYRFELDDPALLGPATTFLALKLTTRDSTSQRLQALQLYQQLLAFHRHDAAPDAFIDADLQRLDFVYRNAVFPDKTESYSRQLRQLAAAYPANATAAEAGYRYLQLQAAAGQEEGRTGRARRNLPQIREQLESLARQFPASEGGAHAALLAQAIGARSLSITAEETLLPDKPGRILVKYKNVPQAWFRVVRVDAANYRQQQRLQRDTFYQRLLAMPAVLRFESALPGTTDLEEHSTEVKVDGLPAGAYAIISSAAAGFPTTDNSLSVALVQVTNLALVRTDGPVQPGRSGYVLHRKTGMPLSDVAVTFYTQRYDSKSQQYIYAAAPALKTAADGSFVLAGDNRGYYSGYSLHSGEDHFYSQEYFSNNSEERTKPAAATRTFFFTDRRIYRPGQTIYFKGIMVRTEADQRQSNVLANAKTTVALYDANDQRISSLNLVTNEYGSVTGSFTTPQGTLTGGMSIRNESGSESFSVEEYKRPKFAVSFDTLKGAYRLNEEVTISGYAKAYAGNNIDGATVKYTVKRQARWPFWYDWWRPMPQSAAQEIAHGTLRTDAAGAFTISFRTQPDKSVDSATLPVFTYSIHVEVTDISGETRSGEEQLSAGYRSLQISAILPEKALGGPDTLVIRTTNLNDVFVPARVTVRITRLQEPDFTPRARLWEMPDQFVLDEAAFRRDFPNDEYRQESRPQSWKAGDEVWKQSLTTSPAGTVRLPAGIFKKNGWYRVEISATDKDGQPISQRQELQVFDPALEGRPVTPLSLFNASGTPEPGGTARLQLVTSYKQLHLLQLTTDRSSGTRLAQTDVADGLAGWKRDITEADRGGLAVQYFTIKNNRIYTETVRIAVPWSNKDLHITWETHRDKLEPGAQETWTVQISGPRKEQAAAEMVASLYDASLDAFLPHSWSVTGLWPLLYPANGIQAGGGFGLAYGLAFRGFTDKGMESYEKSYDELKGFGLSSQVYYFARPGIAGHMARYEDAAAPAPAMASMAWSKATDKSSLERKKEGAQSADLAASAGGIAARYGDASGGGVSSSHTAVPRKNLQETAFFFPQLRTDAAGNIRLTFTMPEALTEWRFLALAHTKDMQVGQLTGTVRTQKTLMVQPNLPRFFRQGDDLVVTAKISNLSPAALQGTAVLALTDAATGQPLNLAFRLQDQQVGFSVNRQASTTATWRIHIPESRYEPVTVRITASAGAFTDGEETTLPVLTNRTLVTETLPLWLNGSGTRTFTFDKLLNSGSSPSLSQYNLTLEYTANPAWYAVQALPYLMEYPYECAEQTFNRYYANALAAHILDKAPRVKQVFNQWQATDTAALQSALEKNGELKSALLAETPWVLDARDETRQKQNIALLFNSYKLAAAQDAALDKLRDMLLPEGAFPWFKGGGPDRYITQYVATGLARLRHLGVASSKADELLGRILPFLDHALTDDYQSLLKSKAKLQEQQISYIQIQYLYLKSFPNTGSSRNANDAALAYYRGQAARYWPKYNAYIKGMIALAASRSGDQQTTGNILASLRETANHSEELGTSWLQPGYGYWWYEAPVEAQSLLIECFTEAAHDTRMVEELKRWLLKQKQTRSWATTKATADACYALLLNGSQWLTAAPSVAIRLGDQLVAPQQQEAGTGYFKQSFTGAAVRPEMGRISVQVAAGAGQQSGQPSWGAVYWQYFEEYGKITGAATPLALRRQLFIERATDRGPVLEEIRDGNALKVGDRVKVRLVLQSDRDMEYLHLKDLRAGCFEPLDVLSGYQWQGGLGYYQSTRDASTNFFMDHLPKGTYVLEYGVQVMAKGGFSAGIATIQCMYAPEFSSHTQGLRIDVQ